MDKCYYCKYYTDFENWCKNKNMAILMSHNYVCEYFTKVNRWKYFWRWLG